VQARPSTRADRSGSGHGSLLIARRGLYERLSAGGPAGVALVSAPAGSGKTALLRSWVDDVELADRVAWVTVERGEQDPQRFWLAVVRKLRAALGADAFVERLTPTPEFDGEAVVERLISELGSLDHPMLLVIDDLHELHSPQALAQFELLLTRRPPLLGVVLATRRDPQLGLHRLRLAGELTEVRAADLRFTLDETRELLAGSGIALSDNAVAMLQARTEGWAAGLRMAALSVVGHPDPEHGLRNALVPIVNAVGLDFGALTFRPAVAGLLDMHRQNTIIAFLQTKELDLHKSNQQLHRASSVSDEQGLPSELRHGVETVRVVEPLFALVDPRLHPHTPLIREESV